MASKKMFTLEELAKRGVRSNFVSKMSISLSTPEAQLVAARIFPSVQKDYKNALNFEFRNLDLKYAFKKDELKTLGFNEGQKVFSIKHVVVYIEMLMEQLNGPLIKEKARIKKIIDDNNINAKGYYTDPISIEFERLSPKTETLTDWLKNFDDYVKLMDSLFAKGFFSSDEKDKFIEKYNNYFLDLSRSMSRVMSKIYNFLKNREAYKKKSVKLESVQSEEKAEENIEVDAPEKNKKVVEKSTDEVVVETKEDKPVSKKSSAKKLA